MSGTIDRKKISLIHVAKAKVGMTDPEYRDLLDSVGVSSSKELTSGQFHVLMKAFENLGFRSRADVRVNPSNQAMFDRVLATCADLGVTRRYADGIAARMFRKKRLEWLTADQLYKVCQAMAVKQRKDKGYVYK